MSELHPVDHIITNRTDSELQKMLLFCMIDSNEPYARVCKTFDALTSDFPKNGIPLGLANGKLDYFLVRVLGKREVHKRIKRVGYHYHNQMTRYVWKWANGPYSDPRYLRTATREQLVHDITGISWKLASMFIRNSRGIVDIAVIDRYIRQFLREKKYYGPTTGEKGYKLMEKKFIEIARDMNITPYKLDMKIWEERRVKHN